MATTQDPRVTYSRSERFRWTSEQYYAIAGLGFFDDKHVELIQGEILRMTINPPHALCMELLADILYDTFKPGNRIRTQLPLDLGRHNQPEPDAVVVAGLDRRALVHPESALLLVEVSDSTLRKDRTIKVHLYARAGIADYWIINLVDRQLEVHRKPEPDPDRRGRFRYAEVTIVPEAGRMAPLAAMGSMIAVADLLPPAAKSADSASP